MSPFDAPRRDPVRTAQIKAWTVEALGLGDDVAVMVTEFRCTEPGCPPLETVVAVLADGGATRQFKIHKPLGDVNREEVRAITNQAGQSHEHAAHSNPVNS